MEKDRSINSNNKSVINKSTMNESMLASTSSTISRIKKRKIIVLGKMGVGK